MAFLDSLKKRRSIYALGKNIVNEELIIESIKTAVKYSPTAFNSQSHRVKILLGEAHDKLWGEIIPMALRAEMDRQGVLEAAWDSTKAKLEAFKAAAGTALFYEDRAVIKKLQEDFPLYADKFPLYSAQSTGIAAVNAWTALAEIGVGANLQHYNPVVDGAIAAEWEVPADFRLESQLVFGSIEEAAADKQMIADEQHFKVVK